MFKSFRTLLPLTVLFAFYGTTFGKPESTDFRVITFNIRYDNPNDNQDAWPNRKQNVANLILFHRAELIGMQEALRHQIDDLATMLPDYAWFGVGRDDGKDKGEFSPIFYRKDRFKLLDSSTFWLSETPETVASKGWDAALPRIVTWGKFQDLKSKKIFFLFNTHFDHRGEQARTNSAKLIMSRVVKAAKPSPVIVTGDFNTVESTEAYKNMIEGGEVVDSYYSTKLKHYGPISTFHGFKQLIPNMKIDYIFVSKQIKVLRHAALADKWESGWPSDHLPVFAELNF